MGDENQVDSFDDLFEPFELEEGPPPPATPTQQPQQEPRSEEAQEQVSLVSCPSCGTANPAYNRHCEACGARLSTAPLPVAPPPMVRATPGGRALGVLVLVILVVLLVALFMNIFSNDEPTETTTTTGGATTEPSTTTTAAPVQELTPQAVEATSTLGTNWSAENLIDGSLATEWQDRSLGGEGAVLTFRFAQPVAINEIEIYNIPDETRFRQNHRIRGYIVTVDDLSFEIPGELRNINTRQTIPVASLDTLVLTIEVTSTYPSEAVDGVGPFEELAVADIRFFGQLAE